LNTAKSICFFDVCKYLTDVDTQRWDLMIASY
jgi:hypothetical protein